MVFRAITEKAPATKQLLFHKIHLADGDERQNIVYTEGIPDQIHLYPPHAPEKFITVEVIPIMVVGRKRSMRDYDVTLDLTDLNGSEYGVSRYHAMLLALDDHIIIKDIDSLNGTKINGKRVEALKEYVIDDEDILTFGDLDLKVKFKYAEFEVPNLNDDD